MTSVERVRVGDVLRLERRTVAVNPVEEYREIGVRSFGRGIFHKAPITGAELGAKRVFRIAPNDLVLSNVFAWEGAIAVAGVDETGFIGSHRFMTFVARNDRIDVCWAKWFFLSDSGLTLIRHASPGSAGRNKTLAIKRFEDLVIPLPPIEEQRRVAESLDRAASRHSAAAAAADHAATLLSALSQSWLDRLVPDAPSRALGELAKIERGRSPRYAVDTGYTALNQGCVRWGALDLSRTREVEQEWWTSVPPGKRATAGDVLVNSTGEGTIGRATVVPASAAGMPFDSHILAVRCSELLLPEYLALFIQSPQGQAQITTLKGANTTKQTELGKAKLERFLLVVPELETQSIVIDAWRSTSVLNAALRTQFAARAERIAHLRASMLNHAFSAIPLPTTT